MIYIDIKSICVSLSFNPRAVFNYVQHGVD